MSKPEFLLCTTPAGKSLELHEMEGQEGLSTTFRFLLELHSDDRKVDSKKMVGKTASIDIVLTDGGKRHIHGIITSFTQTGYDPREGVYIAELRPWLWLLGLHCDNRIFQKKSVPEILEEVFSDLGFKDFKKSLKATYAKREYCVQYQESSLLFVTRLMEEEGIFYFFEHAAGKHTLVLADDSDAYVTCEGSAEARLGALDKDKNTLRHCRFQHALTVNGYAMTDYNFEIPDTDLYVKTGGGDPKLMVYDYPGNYEKKDRGQSLIKLRMESYESSQHVLRGAGNCRGFGAGGKFKLKGHGRADLNREYVLRQVSHKATRSEYQNEFEALPADVVFRPPQQPRRQYALGSQTAVVVGKAGEEIWTDKYGRVKVQFPWDRKGKKDENSSCWIRVAQQWAGKNYGQFFLPRIGQEVVVSFIDGNPDRPLITGTVYNADQTVPYPLPDNQTRSTTKTRTSKGGGGFNELRFEDKKDSEEVYIHAEKDFKTEVKHDRTTTIDNEDKLTVKKNRTVEITEGDESLTIKKGKRTVTVEKDYKLTVKGNLTIEVDGNVTIKSKKAIKLEAETSFDLKSGKDMTVKAGGNLQEEAQMDMKLKAGIGLKQEGVTVETKASAQGTVDGGGMLTIKGGMVKIN
jgi:type VI secretion system secreted protein VgrG